MRTTLKSLDTPERQNQGLVLILPGIEGRSFFNRSVARGLSDAGVPYALRIFDWTFRWPLFLYNLRSRRLHRRQTDALVEEILFYRQNHPTQPVWLIGHSGGGALSLYVLQALPEECSASGAVLLGAAISPGFDWRPAAQHAREGIWNLSSWGDFLFLGAFTTLLGSIDRKYGPCAGMTGFKRSDPEDPLATRLHEMPYRFKYLRDRNLGGHFGYTVRPFVRRTIAPIICPGLDASDADQTPTPVVTAGDPPS